MTLNYKGYYTKKGMTQAVDRDLGGNYTKRNLTENQIQNFKLAEKLGIGVCIEKLDKDKILMNGGIVLNRYLKQARQIPIEPSEKFEYINGELVKMITQVTHRTPSNYRSNGWLISELDKIMKIMRQNKIAHTDLKPQNIVFVFRGGMYMSTDEQDFKHKCYRQDGRLYLIDNDSITPYGKPRQVGTPTVNCDVNEMDKVTIVDEKTDLMGYNFVVNFIKSFNGPELQK